MGTWFLLLKEPLVKRSLQHRAKKSKLKTFGSIDPKTAFVPYFVHSAKTWEHCFGKFCAVDGENFSL